MATKTLTKLSAVGLSKSYGGVHAAIDISYEFREGSVTAVVGDNGAGKSTLIKMLTGVIPPDSGHIEISGQRVKLGSPADARRLGIETVHQDLGLVDHQDAAANIFLGSERTVGFGPFRRLAIGDMRRETQDILHDLQVRIPSVRMEVRKLSGGQRQAIAIGRAVNWGSEILLMDEPLAALGLHESARVESIIQGLAERGLTQIIVSHNLDHVFSLASHVIVMRLGRLVGVREIINTDREEILKMIAGLVEYDGTVVA